MCGSLSKPYREAASRKAQTEMKTYTDFVNIIAESLKNNWDLDALTDYQGVTLQYKDVARKIEKLHILFEMPAYNPATKLPSADATVPTGLPPSWRC